MDNSKKIDELIKAVKKMRELQKAFHSHTGYSQQQQLQRKQILIAAKEAEKIVDNLLIEEANKNQLSLWEEKQIID